MKIIMRSGCLLVCGIVILLVSLTIATDIPSIRYYIYSAAFFLFFYAFYRLSKDEEIKKLEQQAELDHLRLKAQAGAKPTSKKRGFKGYGLFDYELTHLTLTFPEEALKLLPQHTEVHGSENNPYLVNMWELTCTCPDYIKRRSSYEKYDVRRMCKHQLKQFKNKRKIWTVASSDVLKGLVKATNSKGRGIEPYDYFYKIKILGSKTSPKEFYVYYVQNAEWLNTLTSIGGRWRISGYSIVENRWAYSRMTNNSPFYKNSPRYVATILNSLNSVVEK